MLEKLKEMREYEGLTQEEVAKILKVARSTYAGWEIGKDIIPLKKLNILANFYHTSLDYLIGRSPTLEEVREIQKINTSVVSQNLKEFRESKHLTQKEFAEVLTTSQPNIHKYENGKGLITTYYVLEFCKHYDYSLDELVGRRKGKATKSK